MGTLPCLGTPWRGTCASSSRGVPERVDRSAREDDAGDVRDRGCESTRVLSAGEHGTGRNVSALAEMEWGAKARAHVAPQGLFDPDFSQSEFTNEDPHVHKKNLKPSPP